MAITIDINGDTYLGWESCEICDSLEQLGNDFTLTTNIPADITNTIQKGQSLIVRIDNQNIMTGYIDSIDISESADSSQMIVKGRDKTCDFVDSRVSNKTFTPPIGFQQILRKLLKVVGYRVTSTNSLSNPLVGKLGQDQIAVINDYGLIEDFKTTEGISFSPGESSYELIKKLADKRQLILSTDGYGNIVISNIGASPTVTTLQRILDDKASITNNIISASMHDSLHDRFYEYTIASKGTGATNSRSPFFVKKGTDAEKNASDPIQNDVVSYSATVYDEDVRQTRKFYAVVPSLTNPLCKERAQWELNIRKAKDFTYTCIVAGFRQNIASTFDILNLNELNPLWKPNQKIYLVDDRYNLDNEYLIKSVKYKQSNSEGSITELTLIDEYSYTHSIFKPLIKRGKKGVNSNSLLVTRPV